MDAENTLKHYMRGVTQTLSALPWADIARVVDALHDARLRRADIFICGNGGSAATAAHFVNDLNKGANAPGVPRFRAVGLADNVPLLTAWSNDCTYADGFAQQLRNLARPGDVLIGISGSGNSPNVLNAVCLARELGATSIGLAGRGGGKLAELADLSVIVPNACMEQIEDVHLVLEHAIVTALRMRAQGERVPSLLLADGRGVSVSRGVPVAQGTRNELNAPTMHATPSDLPAQPAIFLDRDGVINANRADYVKCWAEVEFLPGAIEALRELAQCPMKVIVISNQSAINRELLSFEVAESIMRRMMAEVAAQGGRIDAAVWCPHRPEEGCGCRKPATGMLTQAADALRLDLSRSFLVGDAESDIAAGMAMGCQTLLVLTGRGAAECPAVEARWGARCETVPDLRAAVQHILTLPLR